MVYEAGLRLDKWLWFARLTPTRAHAQALCESRRLRCDGKVIDRASAIVRPGAVLSWPRGEDGIRVVQVQAIAERRGPFSEARLMYNDLTARNDAGTETRELAVA